MRLLFIIILTVVCFPVVAGVKVNQPLLILLDENGEQVATNSTSIPKAMEKASELPDGVYTLKRPDITITVTSIQENDETVISWTAPTEFTDNTKINKIDEFRIYINDDPVSVSGDKSTYSVNLPAGNHSFYVTAVVNNIESSASNTVRE
jgi:hypothetical protein